MLLDFRVLKTRDGGQNGILDIAGQGGRNPVGIDRVGIEAFGLQKDLMAGLVGEAHDLVLDRRAVARPRAVDLAGEYRCPVEIVANDTVGQSARFGVMWQGTCGTPMTSVSQENGTGG